MPSFIPLFSSGKSSRDKKKRSSGRSYGSSSTANPSLYGNQNASRSMMSLHPSRPPTPGPLPAPQPWQQNLPVRPQVPISYGHPGLYAVQPPLMASQPYLPPLPHSQQQPQPGYTMNSRNWQSSATLPNSVYPSGHNNKSKSRFKTTMSLPAAIGGSLHHAATKSVTNVNEIWNDTTAQYLNQGSALCDAISVKLDDVINSIDDGIFRPGEQNLLTSEPPSLYYNGGPFQNSTRSVARVRASPPSSTSTNHFSKVWLYANSRLPPYLPPFKVYLPTYPLLCLGAQYSLRVYDNPSTREREDHIPASVVLGTKAMTLKSLPIDDMNTIVFAIRGSSSFLDWAVNFRPAPSPPTGFLDDRDNLCHAGFLSVARSMIQPVAARLRTLLTENPSRSASSLLITGHSAGGAVAQLLYAHMLSTGVESELTYLTGFFKRVHCVTFGTPPVSLLPLETPNGRRNRKSLFFSFVNEGDPVTRADKAIVRSLLKLYAKPAPDFCVPILGAVVPQLKCPKKKSRHDKPPSLASSSGPVWNIPDSTLSLGGRIVVMRERYGGRSKNDIEAVTVSDELLREVVYGDPLCHTMSLYARRIEILATKAVTVTGV